MKEKYLFLPPKPKFTNKIIDKKELKKLQKMDLVKMCARMRRMVFSN